MTNRYRERKSEGKRPASIEFEAPQYERLASRAKREQRSMAAVVRIAVEEYLTRHGG